MRSKRKVQSLRAKTNNNGVEAHFEKKDVSDNIQNLTI
jgi:hypothetical protein